MRLHAAIALLLLICPVALSAAPEDKYYYGPMEGGKGYKDRVERDGFWRIDASSKWGSNAHAIDIAIYRAAEMARAAGYPYVELHDARSREYHLVSESVTLFARPSRNAVHPEACRSGQANRCYTADVTRVFQVLGGPSGQQPGVAIVDHTDQYGRTVTRSGFGIGAISDSVKVAANEIAVVATLSVDATGKLTSCDAGDSAAPEVLKVSTCQILLSKARFTPKRDSWGNPVASQTRVVVRYQLPEGREATNLAALQPTISELN